ncbi:cubilin-like isoform X2 [Asterias rubens]|uniref:cubilin-like isoform X2 n=1 Tax=Asterias rubens TaxID=7604 RepID=UPI001455AE05|nr:cubilin-like isoform X2 [Asterias rubens]
MGLAAIFSPLLLGVAFCLMLQVKRSVSQIGHKWEISYTACSKDCGEGVQLLLKSCYTVEAIPQLALESFCNGIAITEPLTISCNAHPCDLCERTLTRASGRITSPYYPDKYSIPKYCRLFVQLPTNKRVLLSFSKFALEGLNLAGHSLKTEDEVCLCGTSVQISDQIVASRSDRYCGTKSHFSWISDSNSILVEFMTQSSHLFNRFSAEYEAIPAKSACYQFIDVTATDKGYVTSPGYPKQYGNNIHCEFALHADPAHGIALTIEEFQLEPSPTCHLDYVTIEDLYTQRKKTVCGTLNAASWLSDSNEVLLTFHSNENDVYNGFIIYYETMNRVPAGSRTFTDPEGTITSPGYPLVYPPNIQAFYHIYADPSQIVVLRFDDFQTERDDSQGQPVPLPRIRRSTLSAIQFEKGARCEEADYVKVEDILAGSSISYCGKLPTFTWFSETNAVLLKFVTDADENYKGFSASYRTLERSPVSDWELVFRAASVTETDVVSKWLDTSRGYNEFDHNAKSIHKEHSPNTYKNSLVNDWANVGITKVKIELYKQGSVVAAFHFKNNPGVRGTIQNWFHCANRLYSTHSDLLQDDCADLVYDNRGIFEITNQKGAAMGDCATAEGKLWLDIHTASDKAGVTSTGTNIDTADVFTIWIQRDCDQSVVLNPTLQNAEFSSDGFALGRNYPNNEHCDYYFLNTPFDRLLLYFDYFFLEHEDGVCTKDYVEIEDLTTKRIDRFCGNQNKPLFTTDGNAAVVRFRSDSFSNFPGWRLQASVQSRNIEDCSSVLTTDSGDVRNADYPSPLTNFRLQGCETILHASIPHRVTLSLTKVHVDLADCPELTIFDAASSTPIIEVSGKIYPFSWTSTSNEMSLWYCTGLPYRSYLFYEGNFQTSISPKPATCIEYFDAEFAGTFSWPTTQLATGSQNCYRVIRTHPALNHRILLRFENLVLKNKDCSSFIKVMDTTTKRSQTTCLTAQRPFTWTSDANEVIVQFFSGPSFSSHAVNGFYSSEPRRPSTESVTLTGTKGEFTSQNFPEDYPSGVHSDYLLQGNAHEVVFVSFLELTLESPSTTPLKKRRKKREEPSEHTLYKRQAIPKTDTKCEYDYIEIKDKLDTSRTVRYCGSQLPFGWLSSSNEVIVTMDTDSSVVKKGFKAEYLFMERPDPTGCGGIFEASNGRFESPSYPRNYPRNADCTYVLLALANQRIKITFTSFNTELDADCQNDRVMIDDQLGKKTDLYCGDLSTPFSWTSKSNLVFVTFHSDAQIEFGGFTATYEFEDRTDKTTCEVNVDDQSGELLSPRFPRLYPNLRECTYVVTVESQFGVQLTFSEFVLEDPTPGGGCVFDYLEIFHSAPKTSDKFCGAKDPFEVLVNSNQVEMIFKSDFIIFYKGFKAKYEAVDLSTAQPGCDQVLTASSGVFTSPNYPANYPLSMDCEIEIRVPSRNYVKITFTDFSLENCPYDYVEVRDKIKNTVSQRFCGRKPIEFSYESESNEVVVFFHSDDHTPSTGFRAVYSAEIKPTQPSASTGCPPNYGLQLSAPSGQLVSPSYPNYPVNVECKIRISVAVGKICKIVFSEFEVEDQDTCSYDYVQLTSIPDDGSKSKWCGKLDAGTVWISKSNVCELKFKSDGFVPARGFKATYETADPVAFDCQQELSGSTGYFASPNYPNNYPVDSTCVTTIQVPGTHLVKIEFQMFDVEEQTFCSYDWVQIRDEGTGVKTPKYCGTYNHSFNYKAKSNKVSVLFFSDEIQNQKGFLALYSAVLP